MTPPVPEYHFRGGAFDAPISLSFEGDKLVVRQGERPPRTLSLSDVVRVRLWWKRERGGFDQYLCSIDFAKPGQPEQHFVTFGSRSHLSANHAESRPLEYRRFLEALHTRLMLAGTRAEFVTGTGGASPMVGFARRIGILLVLGLIASRFVRVPVQIVLLAAAIYAAFQLPGLLTSLRRNAAGHYEPLSLPDRCLPATNAA